MILVEKQQLGARACSMCVERQRKKVDSTRGPGKGFFIVLETLTAALIKCPRLVCDASFAFGSPHGQKKVEFV